MLKIVMVAAMLLVKGWQLQIRKETHMNKRELEKTWIPYGEDEIGSYMTIDYVCIREGLSIRQAMSELIRQAYMIIL